MDMESLIQALSMILGLFLTVGAPILKTNTTITRILDRLETHQNELEDHESLLQTQNKTIQDHEVRIHDLEQEKDYIK